jgi:hypothetical protein
VILPPQKNFAAFQTHCFQLPPNYADPIAGSPSHRHQPFGGKAIAADATYDSMVAGGTSCDVTADTAGYWVPALFEAGVERPPKGTGDNGKGVTVWYSDGGGIHYSFPPNFKMIAGNSAATSPTENPAWLATCKTPDADPSTCEPIKTGEDVPVLLWNCYGRKKSPGGPPVDCKTLGGQRHDLWLGFPTCWVGRGGDPAWPRNSGGWVLDSPNHRDHMAYVDRFGVCPASHPYRLPRVRFQVSYGAFQGSQMTLAGPGQYGTMNPWWTVHGDLWNAWNQEEFEHMTASSPPE